MSDQETIQRAVHDALTACLPDGHIAIGWVLSASVARPDASLRLIEFSGGGHDGTDSPPAWTRLGMLITHADTARASLQGAVHDYEEDDDDADADT